MIWTGFKFMIGACVALIAIGLTLGSALLLSAVIIRKVTDWEYKKSIKCK